MAAPSAVFLTWCEQADSPLEGADISAEGSVPTRADATGEAVPSGVANIAGASLGWRWGDPLAEVRVGKVKSAPRRTRRASNFFFIVASFKLGHNTKHNLCCQCFFSCILY